MYFIRQGSVHILTGDESRIIVTLQAGSFFGEIALVEECRRTATVKTETDTQLCVLHKEDFNAILKEYPSMVEVFQRAVKERKEADQKRKEQEELDKRRKEVEAEMAMEANAQATVLPREASNRSGLFRHSLKRSRVSGSKRNIHVSAVLRSRQSLASSIDLRHTSLDESRKNVHQEGSNSPANAPEATTRTSKSRFFNTNSVDTNRKNNSGTLSKARSTGGSTNVAPHASENVLNVRENASIIKSTNE
jgi:CRP-like cAMP-binding protein